jgi:16S rRNA (uracil1498-N3)-methyltransferase
MRQHKEPEQEQADLAYAGGLVRLFVKEALNDGARVTADPGQAHYVLHVMRGRAGNRVRVFNGRDGEWLARIAPEGKKGCLFLCEGRLAAQTEVPDLWLAFAPVKKTPGEYVAQKATELGVRRLQPVITRRTVVRRVNAERLQANAVEAAEQSERMTVPEIGDPVTLDHLLQSWPETRKLIFCDERSDALPIAAALAKHSMPENAQWGVLTGPEGGFEPEEREAIRTYSFAVPVSLGPRILRADTAALAALSIWQALRGDWR